MFLTSLHPRQAIPTYFIVICIAVTGAVAIAATSVVYWLQSYISPTVVLYDDEIRLNYGVGRGGGKSRTDLPFSNISSCRLSRQAGEKTDYTLMRCTVNDKTKLKAWELRNIEEIGIPISIDCRLVAEILRAGGVNVANE